MSQKIENEFGALPAVQDVKIDKKIGKEHIAVLDLLRGLAALSVVLYHYTANHLLVKFKSNSLNTLFEHGYLGVEIFFVISGFIIPYSLWNTEYTIKDFGRYMMKRIIRIVPPAYVSMLLMVAQWAFIDYLHPNIPGRLLTLSAAQVARNLTFSYAFLDPLWINGVFWTLGVEFQFYIFIGLLFPVLFKRYNIVPFVLAFLVVCLGYFFISSSLNNTFAFFSLFGLGGATLLFRKNSISFYLYFLLLFIFTCVAILMLGAYAAAISTVTALVIAFVRVQHPVFKFFGEISYSLYLTHLVVGSTADFILAKILHPVAEWQHIVILLLCVIIACVVAYIFTQLVEKPFMKLARRLKG